ncbi:MAG: hypothetical protein AB1644_01620 [Candidatus Zixiibacteriota bacterium]
MRNLTKFLLPILPALVIYTVICYYLNYTQDDSYISYRYVANFLDGHGLVFNIGERVEGFTNFGWVIFCILWGEFGLDYILISKIVGLLFGAGAIIVTFLTARRLLSGHHEWYAVVPVYVLAVNFPLAYWAPAGLETAAFAFFAVLSLYLYLKRNHLLIASLLLGVWMRPEGGLAAAVLIAVEALVERRLPLFTLRCSAVAFVLSLPYVVFKYLYYGSIFPNPFYAKTGFTIEQLQSGLAYAGDYFLRLGFVGLGLVVPLLFARKLTRDLIAVWLFTILYTAYIVVVGGDGLKLYRFFLPLFGASAILITASVILTTQWLPTTARHVVLGICGLALMALTYYLPRKEVHSANYFGTGLTETMSATASAMKLTDSTSFSLSVPTIGIIGYELLGHDLIDMVGLTDSTIARHPEEPVPGMTITWKESNYNTPYLLQRAPDYIVFSTGMKPTAPAEQALLLYPQFVESYRSVGWYYQSVSNPKSGRLISAFKKMRPIRGPITRTYPLKWVEYYKAGCEALTARKFAVAINAFNLALAVPGCPPYPEMLYLMAYCYGGLNQGPLAQQLMDSVLARDSLVFGAHADLYLYRMLNHDTTGASPHREWLAKYGPWYLPRLDSVAAQADIRQGESG